MADASTPTADNGAQGLKLRLIGPPPDLAPYLSGYYRTEVAPGHVIEDWLPPEEANLRTGVAEVYSAAIGKADLADVPRAIVSGPTNVGTHLRVGGGKFWGIGLTPAGWARFIDTRASDLANSFVPIDQPFIHPSIAELLDSLVTDGDDLEAVGARINATFRALLGQRPLVESTIHAVHLSILSDDTTAVGPIAAMAGLNPRTFERFCQRHFGFTARKLLSRQRFLRSLGRYMMDPSMRWTHTLDQNYWDQAQFIRDFRATMNMRPSEYAELPHPIVAAAVAVTKKGAGVAHQALYRPEGETGL